MKGKSSAEYRKLFARTQGRVARLARHGHSEAAELKDRLAAVRPPKDGPQSSHSQERKGVPE